MSFSHLVLHLFNFALLLLQLLQNYYLYFCHCYHYYHTTLLLNTLLQILSYPGVVELTIQLLILKNILWLPLCRINKFGLYFTLESCCDPLHLWVIMVLCERRLHDTSPLFGPRGRHREVISRRWVARVTEA